MRSLIVAMAVSFSIASLAAPDPAAASVRKHTDIAAQELGSALEQLMHERDLQVVYFSEDIAGLRTQGTVGDLTAEEALKKLLKGTGLSYRYLDEKTVTVLPTRAAVGITSTGKATSHEQPEKFPHANDPSFWNRLRFAQVDTHSATTSAASQSGAASTDPVKLEQIVVSAQKKGDERLQDVPVPVSVLDAQQLAATSRPLLRDYYTSVPGLSVAPNIETTQMLSIRGITTGSFTIPTVGVMVDDVPYGGSTNSGAGNNVPDIDPGDLARIEVLRGPQGTLYGANTMGGLIKYVTKDPSTDGYSGQIQAGVSSVSNGPDPGFNVRASANVPLSDTLAVRVSGFARQDPGYIDNVFLNRQAVNQADSAGGRLAALWQASSAVSLKLTALYQKTKADGLSDVIVAPGLGDLQQNYVAGVDHYEIVNQAYSAVLKARIGGIDLTSASGYSLNRSTTPFDFTFVFGTPFQQVYGVSGAPFITEIDFRKFSQELRLSGDFGERLDWLLGAFYTHEYAPSSQTLYAADAFTGRRAAVFWYRGVPTTFNEYAGFGDLTYHASDRLDIQFGLRQSHSKETDEQLQSGPYVTGLGLSSPNYQAGTSTGDAFTYLVTPRFKLAADLMMYVRLASGYRPGGPNAFASGVPAKFDPDKTNNYELGLKGSFWDERLTIDTSVYYIDWKNLQLTLFNSANLGYGSNGSGAKSEGVEFSFEARPRTGLTAAGWVSYDNAVLTQSFPGASQAYGASGDRLPNTPRLSANLSLEQEFLVTRDATGFVGGVVSYIGDRIGLFTGSPVRQEYPAYTKTDLRAGLRQDSWTGSLYVNNVTDRRGLTSGGLGYVYPAAFSYIQPRTIGISVTKTF
jgi:iron complex outermembrane recepter protein